MQKKHLNIFSKRNVFANTSVKLKCKIFAVDSITYISVNAVFFRVEEGTRRDTGKENFNLN